MDETRLCTPRKARTGQSINNNTLSPYQRKNLASNSSKRVSKSRSSGNKLSDLLTGRSNSANKENNNFSNNNNYLNEGAKMLRGKRKAVFCDVVLDGLEYDQEGNLVSPEGMLHSLF